MLIHWLLALPVVFSLVGFFVLRRVSLGMQGIIVVLDVLLIVAALYHEGYFDSFPPPSPLDGYTFAYILACALPVIRVISAAIWGFFFGP